MSIKLEREFVVIVTDDSNPQGAPCGRGTWPVLFDSEEADLYIEEMKESFPNSEYHKFKLVQAN